MLQALLTELKCLADIHLCVPLDTRCDKPALLSADELVCVDAGQDIFTLLPDLLATVDLFWPIAPESENILQKLSEIAVAANVEVLLSDNATLAVCADKYATYQRLKKYQIPVVETRLLSDGCAGMTGDIVVKIADGVGCLDSFVTSAAQLPVAVAKLTKPDNYLLQPFINGQAASLSCLFKRGRAWLLAYNHQQIVLKQGCFSLQACLVNVQSDHLDLYKNLINNIAAALPGLWGYIGIDIIQTQAQGPLVLEINPRLTSSYVGIHPATGINVAEQVLGLRHSDPTCQASRNQTIQVTIN